MTTKTATISLDQCYRYDLTRVWDPDGPLQLWVMLNPSTADADVDDPTIRRVMSFAQREGYGGVVVVNRFAFRATDPDDLKMPLNPIGSRNEATISYWLPKVASVVYAWGAKHQRGLPRLNVESLVRHDGHTPLCLGTTQDGHPRHPLYIKGDTPFEPYVKPLVQVL